jgi:hypothetical protein
METIMMTTISDQKSSPVAIDGWVRPTVIIGATQVALWLKGETPGNDWCRRHAMAWELSGTHHQTTNSQRLEAALRDTIIGWAKMAEEHRISYGSFIGEDGVLGRAWKGIGISLLIMLNGDLGRFDGGTLDKLIREIAEASGVNLEE